MIPSLNIQNLQGRPAPHNRATLSRSPRALLQSASLTAPSRREPRGRPGSGSPFTPLAPLRYLPEGGIFSRRCAAVLGLCPKPHAYAAESQGYAPCTAPPFAKGGRKLFDKPFQKRSDHPVAHAPAKRRRRNRRQKNAFFPLFLPSPPGSVVLRLRQKQKTFR